MSKNFNQKLKALYLMKIMMNRTDESHTITMPEIIRELEKYGIAAERKSIYDDIISLKEYGFTINSVKKKTYNYYVTNRTFELPELKLLVDAVQSSKFITHKKSIELIEKIESFASVYEAKQLHRQVHVAKRIKTMNESIYFNVDKIHCAIAQNKQICFNYIEWVVTPSKSNLSYIKASKQFKKNGQKYVISPWALCWDDQNYYAVAYYDKYSGISNFRVDKMENIELVDIVRDGQEQFEKFDMVSYSKKLFGMFGGNEEIVELQFKNNLIGVVIDRFGRDIKIKKADADHFIVSINVEISPTFLAWLFTFGNEVKILSPESVVKQFKKQGKKVLSVY